MKIITENIRPEYLGQVLGGRCRLIEENWFRVLNHDFVGRVIGPGENGMINCVYNGKSDLQNPYAELVLINEKEINFKFPMHGHGRVSLAVEPSGGSMVYHGIFSKNDELQRIMMVFWDMQIRGVNVVS